MLIVRCDAPGCAAESDEVGISWGMEEVDLPKGWREGRDAHYCAAHDCRLADGTYIHNADGLPPCESARVCAYNAVLGAYTIRCNEWEPDPVEVSLPRKAVEDAARYHTASPQWVLA